MKKFKKLTAGLLGVVMAMSVCSFTALAADEVEINDVNGLVAAIMSQADGGADNETWILADGEYDLGDLVYTQTLNNEKFKINGETGFVFPIIADGLTIKAEEGADVLITSSYNPGKQDGGIWHNQNFITISGSNVTIQDVDIKGNPNDYPDYDGTCNKAIELIDGAKDFTIENVEICPVKNDDGYIYGGSIYFNVADPGTSTIKDVTMHAWISAGNVTSGTIKIENVVQDFEKNMWTTAGPGIVGDEKYLDIDGFTIQIDDENKIGKNIFGADLKNGTTIELKKGEYHIDETMVIDKDVTLIGNGSTITVDSDITGSGNGNNAAIEIHNGANVELKDLTVEGNNNVKHGINIFSDANSGIAKVNIDGVTVNNCQGYGLVNNSSDVTVEDMNTSGNDWGGINVDNKYNNEEAKFVMESGNIEEETSVKVEKTPYGDGEQLTTYATIKGGTFGGTVESRGISELTIKGGNFEGEVEADGKENLTITSGTFSNDVSDYMDPDSTLVKDDDGNFVIMDEEEYEDYLDSKRPTHSYELEEGKVDRNEDKEEPVVTTKPEEEAGPFSDVGKDNPNYDAIIKVYEKGWMAGIGDGVFAPNGTLTRAMGATVLWNKAGKPEPQNVAPFLDVTGDAWYAKAVAWAYEQGIIAGYDAATFGPDDALTTEQFTRMNDIATGNTPAVYVGGAPNATRGWVASLLAL